MPHLSLFTSHFSTPPAALPYNSALSLWLSVDPLSDKYPNLSPYVYCVNNPIRIIDPDGRDWFENEKTGDVYYSRDYHKGDEHLIDGDGWKWMGKNGMFGKSDHSVICDHFQQAEVFAGDDEISRAAFSGDNAKGFMSDMGYKSVPTQVITYDGTYSQKISDGKHSFSFTYGHTTDYVEKIGYVPNSYQENGRSVIGRSVYGKGDPICGNFPSVSRYSISYGRPPELSKVLGIICKIPFVLNGIHNYSEHFTVPLQAASNGSGPEHRLVKKFVDKYPH